MVQFFNISLSFIHLYKHTVTLLFTFFFLSFFFFFFFIFFFTFQKLHFDVDDVVCFNVLEICIGDKGSL